MKRYERTVIIATLILIIILLAIQFGYSQIQDPGTSKMNPLLWTSLFMGLVGLFALAGIVREFLEPFNELREQKKYLRKCREWRRKYKNDKQENE